MSTSLRPLVEFIDPIDIPLYEFLPDPDKAFEVLAKIEVCDVWSSLDESGFTLAGKFLFVGIEPIALPGVDLLKLDINSDLLAEGTLTSGEEISFEINDFIITLVFDPSILSVGDSKQSAKISTKASVRFDREGFHFINFSEAYLTDARVAGTGILVNLTDIELSPNTNEFLTVGKARISLPAFKDAEGDRLEFPGTNVSLGRRGLGGRFEMDSGKSLEVKILGFDCRLHEAIVQFEDGQLTVIDIQGSINVSKFAKSKSDEGWIDVAFSIGASGVLATLRNPDSLLKLQVEGIFTLNITAIRLESGYADSQGVLWLSGSLIPEVTGVTGAWPEFEFDELGITANGDILMAEGASIATTQPFTVNWSFAQLTVSAFSIERPKDDPAELVMRISAGVELIKGIPAGVSVEGLVARRKGNSTSVSFNGIGLKFGSPGSFAVAVTASYDSELNAFTGEGHLDVEPIDLRLDVVFDARTPKNKNFASVFVAAETSLIPGGIPIGSTGLSLYSVSGMLAYNRELAITGTGPDRFFELFNRQPVGLMNLEKWVPRQDAMGFGLGVVLGTADDGWAFSARGALIITLPQLSVFVAATADVLTARQPINDIGRKKLAALLAILPTERMLRLDFQTQWEEDNLFSVSGSGGGEFHFDDLNWSLWLGREPNKGSPVSAQFLKFDTSWLMSTNFWFSINSKYSVDIGALAQIEFRFGGGGLYAEVVGHASVITKFVWQPLQLEGAFQFNTSARLVAGELSFGFKFIDGANFYAPQPKLFRVPLSATMTIKFGDWFSVEATLSYTFEFAEENKPPQLKNFQQGLSFIPRHWVPREVSGAVENEGPTIDNGIKSDPLGEVCLNSNVEIVQPHSVIVIEFSKSVNVAAVTSAVKINQLAHHVQPLAIGEKSGFGALWNLTALELKEVGSGNKFNLFGTFSGSPSEMMEHSNTVRPRPANTELRLLSSNRFGQGGSLSGGALHVPPMDCTHKPTTVRDSISLKNLKPGWGFLSNGWIYEWRSHGAVPGHQFREHGVALVSDDYFCIWSQAWPAELYEHSFQWRGELLGESLPASKKRKITLPLSGNPLKLALDEVHQELFFCGLIFDDGSGDSHGWSGSSGMEEWTVDPGGRLLRPNCKYELTWTINGCVVDRNNKMVNGPFQFDRKYSFQVAGAPDWAGALERSITAIYPSDGIRPAYLGYDLLVQFKDDYFEALYRMDKSKQLGVRLIDSNGIAVLDRKTKKVAVHLPFAWGPVTKIDRSLVEEFWLAANVDSSCANIPPLKPPMPVLQVDLGSVALKPLVRYRAELVAVDSSGEVTSEALVAWSFTTSAYHTFEGLASPPKIVAAFALEQLNQSTASDFDSLIRSFNAATVAVVTEMRITPVTVSDAVAYILIESPEPLDDAQKRLCVVISGEENEMLLFPNLDWTRLIAKLIEPVTLQSIDQVLQVSLRWQTHREGAPVANRSIKGRLIDETSEWRVPLRRCF